VEEVDSNFGKQEPMPCVIFLFNDVLMIARRRHSPNKLSKKSKQPYKFIGLYHLDGVNMVVLRDSGMKDCFQIETLHHTEAKHLIQLGPSSPDKKTDVDPAVVESDKRIVHVFRSPVAEKFVAAFRQATDDLIPCEFEGSALVYRRWSSDNVKQLFYVHASPEAYRASTKKVCCKSL
jgi:hypothetical protein